MKRFSAIILSLFIAFGTAFAQETAPSDSTYPNAKNVYYEFNGTWLPDLNSEQIGGKNYKTLTNLRPTENSIEGVNGYSKINTTANSGSYYRARAGFHFKKDYPQESHVLTQFYNFDGTQSQIFDNETSIPNQGNYNTDPIHIDLSYGTFTGTYAHRTTGSGVSTPDASHSTSIATIASSDNVHRTKIATISTSLVLTYETPRARFVKGPVGHVVYSNGVESQIWGGNESRVAAFILSSSDVTEYATNPQDYTNQINNEYDTSTEVVSIDATGGTAYFLVGATRPISGVSFYVKTANSGGGTLQIAEWNGSIWSDLAETDGTNALSQNGQVSFDSTVNTAEAKYLEGYEYYWYLGQLSAGSADVYYMTLNIPWQDIKDLWDQVYRTPIAFQVYKSHEYKDWTRDVVEISSDLYPIGAKLGGVQQGDYIIAGFEDRLQAIYFEMLSGNTNNLGSGTTISTWNGSSWAISSVTYDGTADITGVSPLGQTGALTWQPPDYENEFPQYLFGKRGYFYRIDYGGTLGDTDAPEEAVLIDRVFGITAPFKLPNFKFAAYHLNRIFLIGYLKGNQPNRVDFSSANAPEVWNGRDSSDNNGVRLAYNSIFVGGNEEITAAKSVFNRHGSRIYSQLVFFKRNELYTMLGSSPDPEDADNFEVHQISEDIGCPASSTLTSIEVGFLLSQWQPERNILVWLSSSGPYIFDGSFPKPLRGIDSFFDYNDANYVGSDNIENAFAWYDSNYSEWNLVVGDYWFVYSFKVGKWFTKDTNDAEALTCAIPVIDTKGNRYIYGALDTGYLMRLENGNSWDGSGVTQIVETGDFYLDGNPWNETILKRYKLAYKVIDEDATVQVDHYADTDASSGDSIFSANLSAGSLISRRQTEMLNKSARLHRLKMVTQTSDTNKGLQPLGQGYQYIIKREDVRQ